MSSRTEPKEVECICGGLIHETPLPPDLQALSGRKTLWIHDHGDIYCYPDSTEACAEPGNF